MERRPLGLLQALLQSTGLVGPLAGERHFLILNWEGPEHAIYWEGPEHAVYWEGPEHAIYPGGLRAATTMGRVTLGTAAAATVTGLPSARTQRNTIGLGRYRSLSGLLGLFRFKHQVIYEQSTNLITIGNTITTITIICTTPIRR